MLAYRICTLTSFPSIGNFFDRYTNHLGRHLLNASMSTFPFFSLNILALCCRLHHGVSSQIFFVIIIGYLRNKISKFFSNLFCFFLKKKKAINVKKCYVWYSFWVIHKKILRNKRFDCLIKFAICSIEVSFLCSLPYLHKDFNIIPLFPLESPERLSVSILGVELFEFVCF